MALKGLERTTINDIQMLERRYYVHHFFRYELWSITSFNFEVLQRDGNSNSCDISVTFMLYVRDIY